MARTEAYAASEECPRASEDVHTAKAMNWRSLARPIIPKLKEVGGRHGQQLVPGFDRLPFEDAAHPSRQCQVGERIAGSGCRGRERRNGMSG